MTAVPGALGELLAWAAWVPWLLLGFARARPQAGDVVDDRGTWRWGMSVMLASVLAAVAVSAAVPALTLRNWLSLLVVTAGFLVSHVPRIRVEERLLEQNLGEPYRQFERTRKRLIPGPVVGNDPGLWRAG